MGIKYQKMAIVMGAISLSLSVIEAKSAQASDFAWGISFFDATGTQVGSGAFSYDTDTTTFVQTSPGVPSVPRTGFNVNTALKSFAATILGTQWSGVSSPGIGVTWLDPTNGLEQQRFGRSPQPSIANSWFFGDTFGGSQQLLLEGQVADSGNLEGSWLQYIGFNYPNSGSGSGSWIAALQSPAEGVPEPTTVLGAVTFGIGCLLRKKIVPGKK